MTPLTLTVAGESLQSSEVRQSNLAASQDIMQHLNQCYMVVYIYRGHGKRATLVHSTQGGPTQTHPENFLDSAWDTCNRSLLNEE